MKDKNDKAFHPHLLHHMAGAQKPNTKSPLDMKGFLETKRDWLKEQELFYRATDYRGS